MFSYQILDWFWEFTCWLVLSVNPGVLRVFPHLLHEPGGELRPQQVTRFWQRQGKHAGGLQVQTGDQLQPGSTGAGDWEFLMN